MFVETSYIWMASVSKVSVDNAKIDLKSSTQGAKLPSLTGEVFQA